MASPFGALARGIAGGLRGQREQSERDAQMAFQLFGMLANAPEEQEPALRAMIGATFPRFKFEGAIPRAPKPMLDRPARSVWPEVPEGVTVREWIAQRPDYAEKIYGKAAEKPEEEFDRLMKAHALAEQRQGKKVPMTGRLLALAKQLGVSVPTTRPKTPLFEERPAAPVTGTGPGLARAGLPQRVQTGVQEGEEQEVLPAEPADYKVDIPGMGRVRLGQLPAGAQTAVINKLFEQGSYTEIETSQGRLRVPNDKALAYIQHTETLETQRGERRYYFVGRDGTKLGPLTAAEYAQLYTSEQQRLTTERGQDVAAATARATSAAARSRDLSPESQATNRRAAREQAMFEADEMRFGSPEEKSQWITRRAQQLFREYTQGYAPEPPAQGGLEPDDVAQLEQRAARGQSWQQVEADLRNAGAPEPYIAAARRHYATLKPKITAPTPKGRPTVTRESWVRNTPPQLRPLLPGQRQRPKPTRKPPWE